MGTADEVSARRRLVAESKAASRIIRTPRSSIFIVIVSARARRWSSSVAEASNYAGRFVEDGLTTIVATPTNLPLRTREFGSSHSPGHQRVDGGSRREQIPLDIPPGGDIRVDERWKNFDLEKLAQSPIPDDICSLNCRMIVRRSHVRNLKRLEGGRAGGSLPIRAISLSSRIDEPTSGMGCRWGGLCKLPP